MNRGNTKPKTPQKVDILVEALNKRIGRLMGKKNKLPPGKKTSNLTFSIIALILILMLWLATGFYYLNENQFGLLMQNGKINRIVKGIKVGLVLPYPFGDVEVIDASVSDPVGLAKTGMNNGDFTILSLDLVPLKIDAKFNYQVTDPALVFKTSMPKQNSLDNLAAWNVQTQLHNYFASKTKNDILKSNLTVIAGEIKNIINAKISTNGIKIVKLSINSVAEANNIAQNPVPDGAAPAKVILLPIDKELLQQANEYKQSLIEQTNADIDSFNQLLPQYKVDPKTVTEQMYFTALNAIPESGLLDQYPLLKLNLSDLIMLNQTNLESNIPIKVLAAPNMRERHFGRVVNRDYNRYTDRDNPDD